MVIYNVVRKDSGWTIAHNGSPQRSYATKEAALEAAYTAASNAIESGFGITAPVDAA